MGCFFCKHHSGPTVSGCPEETVNVRLQHREGPKGGKSLMWKAFTWDGGATCSRPILNQRVRRSGQPSPCSTYMLSPPGYSLPLPCSSPKYFSWKCFCLVPRWNKNGVKFFCISHKCSFPTQNRHPRTAREEVLSMWCLQSPALHNSHYSIQQFLSRLKIEDPPTPYI